MAFACTHTQSLGVSGNTPVRPRPAKRLIGTQSEAPVKRLKPRADGKMVESFKIGSTMSSPISTGTICRIADLHMKTKTIYTFPPAYGAAKVLSFFCVTLYILSLDLLYTCPTAPRQSFFA